MIFVTVGSTDFDALIAAMDGIAPLLEEEVVMQIGLGSYTPEHGRFFRFAPSLDGYYDQAGLVVSHGGLGTIVEVLERGKRLVCVVNPTTYDRHQEHLLRVFADQNCLLWCKDLAHLEEALERAKAMHFSAYQPPPSRIHEVIWEYLHTGSPSNAGRSGEMGTGS